MPTPDERQRLRDACPICLQPLVPAGGSQLRRERATECHHCTEVHCVNSRLGCSAEGTVAEMKKHEVICYYRWIRCAWHLQCGRHEISLSEYRRHLEEMHKPYIKKIRLNEEDDIVVKTEEHSLVRTGNVIRLEGSEAYFVRRCLFDLSEDLLLICLHYIGPNEEAGGYTYTIRIKQGIHHAKYTWTSYCLPYVENSNSCMTLPNCNVFRPSKIFLTKDYLREIHYTVTIKRL